MKELTPEDEDPYEGVAWFDVAETHRLFSALEARGVRFQFEANDDAIRNMNPLSAVYLGGTFGLGAKVYLWVHKEDREAFWEAHRSVFDPAPANG